MENVKVALWGFGAMGSGIGRALLAKSGVEIVGVCDKHPDRVGKNMYDVLGVDPAGRPPVVVSGEIENVVQKGKCDICILATDSFVKAAFDKILFVVNQGVNVITSAEEMAYPMANHPDLSKKIDEAAKANGVSVLGTGINPGLVMDLLAICLSGSMTDVESVMCRRVNSLSPFGEAVMEEQGVGITVDAFNKGVAEGTLAGHVGFAESIGMISDALGLGVNEFSQSMSPIVTSVDRKSPYGFAAAGNVAGVDMKGDGKKDGKLLIHMEHPQQIEPELEDVFTGDYIVLKGSPEVSMEIKPEISGGIGTIAMCINCIPQVINAKAGLITMIDIPVPHAIMGDYRDYIDPERKLVK
ncbi:NADP-binding protein [Clostridia bacterium OttesenSCG-928-O13]|nr:NADP-binding protein [Clostridia bacterium OttesenSCG-928-O13]